MPPKADTLLSLDRTLYNTWVTYMDFLKSPNSDPTVVADFLDRLADQPDEYLGYTNVPYLEWRTRWMIRLGREQEAVDAWIKGIVYHSRGSHYDEYKKLQDLPLLQQAEKDYFRAHPLSSCDPLVWLEQGPLPVKRRKDYISNTPCPKAMRSVSLPSTPGDIRGAAKTDWLRHPNNSQPIPLWPKASGNTHRMRTPYMTTALLGRHCRARCIKCRSSTSFSPPIRRKHAI